jgi:hypothetical protein
MPKRSPWHSTQSDVYHDNTECNTGNNVKSEYRRPGTGGKTHHSRTLRVFRAPSQTIFGTGYLSRAMTGPAGRLLP